MTTNRAVDEIFALVGVVVREWHNDVRVVEHRLELLVILPVARVVLRVFIVWMR